MQQPLGETIRQIRRSHNLTQAELGGSHYSKSYVSAVEHEKISPSLLALEFFAEQLGQPSDYFTQLLQQVQKMNPRAVSQESSHPGMTNRIFLDESFNLLDILLENTEFHALPAWNNLSTLPMEAVGALPPHKQGQYFFLSGLMAQSKQNLPEAQLAYERALALAPEKFHPLILDKLGTLAYALSAYETALGYHLRGIHSLANEPSDNTPSMLHFKLELHCGDDYNALNANQAACEHYEQARQFLNSEHDMKTAGSLYLGLGYCTYALIQQETAHSQPIDIAHMERQFQRSIGFLIQSRSIYQVSGDRNSETAVRLMLITVLLDFSLRRQQIARQQPGKMQVYLFNCSSLVDEAIELCRQTLLQWQESFTTPGGLSVESTAFLYTALAYLIRAHVQHATLARLHTHEETSFRQRSLAANLCQQTLDSFSDTVLLETAVSSALSPQANGYHPTLPRLPKPPWSTITQPHSAISQFEIYFSAAEVAEELGRGAQDQKYARDCYSRANQCLETAFAGLDGGALRQTHDSGYIARYYQRCLALLEERSQTAPEYCEETNTLLLKIAKDALHKLQRRI